MQTGAKILLVAGALSLFAISYIFDLQSETYRQARTFAEHDARVIDATGGVKDVHLGLFGRQLGKGRTHMFLHVRGETRDRTVQITAQDASSGRVQSYCISNAGCFEAELN